MRFSRWFLQLIEKHFYCWIKFILIVALLALIVAFMSKFYPSLFNCLNFPDTIFAIAIGVLTIFGLIIAIVTLRGFFDRVSNFKSLLKQVTRIIKDAQEYIVIFGFYPAFGALTMKGENPFQDYVEEIKKKLGNLIYFTICYDEENQKKKILEIAEEVYNWESDSPDILDAISENKKWSKRLEQAPDVDRNGHTIPSIFYEYNELPDFHLVFSEKDGIIFVPLRLTRGKRIPKGPADMIGITTLDKDLISQFNDVVEYYSGINIKDYIRNGGVSIILKETIEGRVGQTMEEELRAIKKQPFTWKIESGALPPGIELVGAKFIGTPEQEGKFPDVEIRVTDQDGRTCTKKFIFKIRPLENEA